MALLGFHSNVGENVKSVKHKQHEHVETQIINQREKIQMWTEIIAIIMFLLTTVCDNHQNLRWYKRKCKYWFSQSADVLTHDLTRVQNKTVCNCVFTYRLDIRSHLLPLSYLNTHIFIIVDKKKRLNSTKSNETRQDHQYMVQFIKTIHVHLWVQNIRKSSQMLILIIRPYS